MSSSVDYVIPSRFWSERRVFSCVPPKFCESLTDLVVEPGYLASAPSDRNLCEGPDVLLHEQKARRPRVRAGRTKAQWVDVLNRGHQISVSALALLLLLACAGLTVGCTVSRQWYSGVLVLNETRHYVWFSGVRMCARDVKDAPGSGAARCGDFADVYGIYPAKLWFMWVGLFFMLTCSVAGQLLILTFMLCHERSYVLKVAQTAALLPLISLLGLWGAESFALQVLEHPADTRRQLGIFLFLSALACSLLAAAILCLLTRRPRAGLAHLVEDDLSLSRGIVELSLDGLHRPPDEGSLTVSSLGVARLSGDLGSSSSSRSRRGLMNGRGQDSTQAYVLGSPQPVPAPSADGDEKMWEWGRNPVPPVTTSA